jgi:hypothetical protein
MTIHHNRRHPEDAPGSLGVILTSLDPLDNTGRLEGYREMLADFYRARMEPVAPDLFPDHPLLEPYCEFGRLK